MPPAAVRAESYDGLGADAIARSIGAARLALFDEVPSTQDVAHDLAREGAPAGTLVLADRQTAGRGRGGRAWTSAPGAGIWMTLVERPADAAAVEVLSLRLGLHAAAALERFAEGPVRLKWPNDLYVDERKLAGILVEARWREARPEWVAIGFGLNVLAPPGVPGGVGLRAGVPRVAVLERLLPAVREAAALRGPLTEAELAQWTARDLARGRRCLAPEAGVVRGITAGGELVIATTQGDRTYRGGSLVLQEER